MGTAAARQSTEIAILRDQNQVILWSIKTNTEGISHADSLVQPKPGGNSMNWVVGHLLCVYNKILPGLGQSPLPDSERLQRYDRGSSPIQDHEALDFTTLLTSIEEAARRFDAGMDSLQPEALDRKAPFSPRNNPEETLRSLVTIFLFHQAYHAGQTGILRRVIGKPGAVK